MPATPRLGSGLGDRLRAALGADPRPGDAAWEAAEEALVAADLGPRLAAEVVIRARGRTDGGQLPSAAIAAELRGRLARAPVEPFEIGSAPSVILVVGVNGSGKTTTAAKLAARYLNEGRSVLLAAADTYRPGAVEQLRLWGDRLGVAVVAQRPGADPAAVAFDAVAAGIARGIDVVIIDTAGRLHTARDLMAELAKIRRVIARQLPDQPRHVLLVMDATTGQNGLAQAETFLSDAGVTGIVLAKLDGTAKGGVAVAVAERFGIPIVFTGFGEELDALARFDPDAYVDWLMAALPRPSTRMLETLSTRLQDIAARLRGQARLTEADLDAALRDVRLALLEADVHFRVVKTFVARVRERALGAAVLDGVRPGHQVVKLVHEELVEILGGQRHVLEIGPPEPAVVLLVGLQGSGKTTSAAKLAARLRRDGHRPLLVAADVYRPAAVEQLVRLGAQIGIEVVTGGTGTEPLAIAEAGVEAARRGGGDVVIVDTAGRQHVDAAMMAELEGLVSALRPAESLLVVDAMTGQDAVRVAETFHARLPLTGLIITKMDGDARGGAALSIRTVTGVPIAYVGTGEETDALEAFHPDRLAQRILGMGDIVTLVERAEEGMDREAAERAAQSLMESRFTLEDFRAQIQQVKRMGPIDQLVQMIPGAAGFAGAARAAVDEGQLRRVEAIIDSMTPVERREPHLIKAGRRRRIAAGSGTTVADVNRLLRQFEEMQKVFRQLGNAGARPGSTPRLPRR